MDQPNTSTKKPICVIVLGMAGSGKTTFVGQLISHLQSTNQSVYAVNLDPAVHHLSYEPNIDIRDTVKFKEVMKQYGFGPNGAIMTSLNFFASQFNKVIDLIGKKSESLSYVILDTPGQIEVFTWSASGTIISESLGSAYPTVVVYIMDTPRSHNPVTFMSNMLYACSVLYRMRLPFIVVLNKTDVIDCQFAIDWMRDFEAFQDALSGHQSDGPAEVDADEAAGSSSSPYMSGLMNSMSLVLDEFYSQLRCCGVSSITGDGIVKFVSELELAKEEYYNEYVPLLRSRRSDTGATSKATGSRSSKYNQSKKKSMLVDLIGDNDDAEDDPLVDLDGVEDRSDESSTNDEDTAEMRSLDDRFRQMCNSTGDVPQ